jgi:hypothetical protein
VSATIPGLEPDQIITPDPALLPAADLPTSPCAWSITPSTCDAAWTTYPDAVQDAAIAYASTVLWASTGRAYGTCQLTVRPDGRWLNSGQWAWDGGYGWGYPWWGGGGWYAGWLIYGPNWNGWCCNNPQSQIWLPGPVASVLQVLVNNVIVDPSTWRVDDNQWLVAQGFQADGKTLNTWPFFNDFNQPTTATNTMQVSYLRGKEPPVALLNAAGILASEYAKACVGAPCSLPSRVTSIVRQGVTITEVNFDLLLENGYTGINSVDNIIRAYNPKGITARMRIVSPDVSPYVRTTTQL